MSSFLGFAHLVVPILYILFYLLGSLTALSLFYCCSDLSSISHSIVKVTLPMSYLCLMLSTLHHYRLASLYLWAHLLLSPCYICVSCRCHLRLSLLFVLTRPVRSFSTPLSATLHFRNAILLPQNPYCRELTQWTWVLTRLLLFLRFILHIILVPALWLSLQDDVPMLPTLASCWIFHLSCIFPCSPSVSPLRSPHPSDP